MAETFSPFQTSAVEENCNASTQQFGDITPFGMTNAPATFQRMMSLLFKEELDAFVLVYLDDILIFSQALEEHIPHIRVGL